jgi:hypothetical protein
MKTQTASPGASIDTRDKVTALVGQIREEQQGIDRNDASTVVNQIRIGSLLIRLKAESGWTWTRTVREIGYHPRAASRLLRLGTSWLAGLGTAGSEFLHRLPTDLQKLDWLCRLTRTQLEQLLTELDCKHAGRAAVAAAVKHILNPGAEAPRTEDLPRAVGRVFKRVVSAIRRWHGEADTDSRRHELRGLLAAGLRQAQAVAGLEVSGPPTTGAGGNGA